MIKSGFLLLMLTVSIFGGSDAAWCVCQPDVSTTALQKTLDYACGDGADRNPILQDGACYNPDTVLSHCSYGANSFHQRNGQAQTARDFSATAMLKQICANGCLYPATPSATGTSSTPPSTSTTSRTATPHTFSSTSSVVITGFQRGLHPGTFDSLWMIGSICRMPVSVYINVHFNLK